MQRSNNQNSKTNSNYQARTSQSESSSGRQVKIRPYNDNIERTPAPQQVAPENAGFKIEYRYAPTPPPPPGYDPPPRLELYLRLGSASGLSPSDFHPKYSKRRLRAQQEREFEQHQKELLKQQQQQQQHQRQNFPRESKHKEHTVRPVHNDVIPGNKVHRNKQKNAKVRGTGAKNIRRKTGMDMDDAAAIERAKVQDKHKPIVLPPVQRKKKAPKDVLAWLND